MNSEFKITKETEAKKESWLRKLADFIVIANNKTWAAEGAEVEPRRPGYKRLQWPYAESTMNQQDKKDYQEFEDWRLEDEYVGYFRAPGMTTVYYKNLPVWTMQYGGHGQNEEFYKEATETFSFLKKALMRVSAKMPLRGPKEFRQDNKRYEFEMNGDLTDCTWEEKIFENGELTFSQKGLAGIVINKNNQKQPIYPWEL